MTVIIKVNALTGNVHVILDSKVRIAVRKLARIIVIQMEFVLTEKNVIVMKVKIYFLWTGFFGENCELKKCGKKCENGKCENKTGKCICEKGWGEEDCSKKICEKNCNYNVNFLFIF